jgi:hypothetical protein
MNNEPITGSYIGIGSAMGLTQLDLVIIESVDRYLSNGLALKRWWDKTYPGYGFAERFDLERAFNRPDNSFGFFDQVQLDHGIVPVMGNYQDMLYDQPRTPTSMTRQAAEWMRDQVCEFVLTYFMRVSSFRQPEIYVESERLDPPPYLERLSWCPEPDILRQGFGFSQQYYKLRETGEVGKFPSQTESAIVDLREIGQKYEWIVVKVRIFNFKFTFKPFGPNGIETSVPLTEESYLVLTREFILNEENPAPGLLGRYGLGYAFIKNPTQGLIAFGPGEFDAAIELINFEVDDKGQTRVAMVFVVNRPERIANVQIDPVDWSVGLADIFSFGMTSRMLSPVKGALDMLPTSLGSFDPILTFISLANSLTGNQAAQRLCISRRQLEKDFLAQHFLQHYTTIVGSLMTWRQIPNWLDSAALPEWVVTGKSS